MPVARKIEADDEEAGGAVVPLDPSGRADAPLLERALEGDRDAAERLVRRHIRPVTAMVTRMVGNPDVADELVQDTFLVALRRLHQVKNPASLRAWLLTIAARRVRQRLSRERFLRALGLRGGEAFDFSSLASPSASPEARAELASLARVLQSVTPAHRLAWMLRNIEGYSLGETAELSACSLATVKRWIDRVDRHIREQLGDRHA